MVDEFLIGKSQEQLLFAGDVGLGF